MRPPDAIDGWDDAATALSYDRFTRTFPFYDQTSRDLVDRVALHDTCVALDLCGGTGVTASAILDAVPAPGRVITIDASRAMQSVGRRSRPDPRIRWVHAKAEDAAHHVLEPVGTVLCNAGIWKTDTPVTFTAAHAVLHHRGVLAFNIGGGFAGLPPNADAGTGTHGPSLNDLIHEVALRRHGIGPPPPQSGRPPLTKDRVARQLRDTGFDVDSMEIVTHTGTLEEKKAWLSIPAFARPAGHLTHDQRLQILDEAYELADKDRPVVTAWLVVVATVRKEP